MHDFGAGGDLIQIFAFITIGGADGDFLKAGKHVKLSQCDTGYAVHSHGVAHAHGVEPATAARSACGCAELRAFASERFAVRSVKFSRKRAAADPSRIRFGYADDLLNMLRADTGPRTGAAGDCA